MSAKLKAECLPCTGHTMLAGPAAPETLSATEVSLEPACAVGSTVVEAQAHMSIVIQPCMQWLSIVLLVGRGRSGYVDGSGRASWVMTPSWQSCFRWAPCLNCAQHQNHSGCFVPACVLHLSCLFLKPSLPSAIVRGKLHGLLVAAD